MTPRPSRTDENLATYAIPDVLDCLLKLNIIEQSERDGWEHDQNLCILAKELFDMSVWHRSHYSMAKFLEKECMIDDDAIDEDMIADMSATDDIVDKTHKAAISTWIKAYGVVCPFVTGQTVRHIKERWTGTVKEIFSNDGQITVFSKELGHVTEAESHKGLAIRTLSRFATYEELEPVEEALST